MTGSFPPFCCSDMGNTQCSPSLSAGEPDTRKTTERGESDTLQIQYAVSGMKGMRITMEDRHLCCLGIPLSLPVTGLHGSPSDLSSPSNNYNDGKPRLEDHCLFAVFDGHGGDFASNYLQRRFLSVFSEQDELLQYAALPRKGFQSRADVNGILLLKQALFNTFAQLDRELFPVYRRDKEVAMESKDATSKNNDKREPACIRPPGRERSKSPRRQGPGRAGSTAVVVVLTPTQIICANVGDSRAVLRRFGKVFPLSFDHKPCDLPERLRIVAAGGTVKSKRVDGDLAVSRALGDFVYKETENLPAKKQKVIAVPDIVTYPRSTTGDEFIVLACDGIWDVATNKQCSDFIQFLLSEGEQDLGNICEEVLDTCLERKSRDNMTMLLVGLQGMQKDVSSSAIMNNAIWGHRAARRARKMTSNTVDATLSTCSHIGDHFVGVR